MIAFYNVRKFIEYKQTIERYRKILMSLAHIVII